MMKELWKPIKGYEGYYEVSNFGRVRSIDRTVPHLYKGKVIFRHYSSKIMKINTNKCNQIRITLCKNSTKEFLILSKVVAEAWIPNPNNYCCVIHKDNNKYNNNVSNLKWVPYNLIPCDDIEEKLMKEEWRPVPGYEDLYEVSNTGKVRSIPRIVIRSRNRNNITFSDVPTYQSKELKPYRYNKKSGVAVYHLHRRLKPGYYGQSDSYSPVEDLMQLAFPELYEKEN